MSTGGESPGFEEWLLEVSRNPDAPVDDPGIVSDAWRRWLRRFFDDNGPVSRDVVMQAAEAKQLALANDAAAAVLADVHAATSLRPAVVVDAVDHSIRIRINGGYQMPSILQADRPAAFAEAADYFQDQLDQECWPVCSEHGVGLHGEVHDERAVWWCRLGGHAVARIGYLGSSLATP